MSRGSRRRSVRVCVFLVAACSFLVGCGTASGPNPPRVRVTGQVLLDGHPAPAGTIVFVPLAAGQLQAQGIIGDDGTFAIEPADGPSAGEYKVQIQCAKKTGRRVQSLGSSDGTGMADERVPVIPPRYNTATTLRQTITAGDNTLVFRLQSGR